MVDQHYKDDWTYLDIHNLIFMGVQLHALTPVPKKNIAIHANGWFDVSIGATDQHWRLREMAQPFGKPQDSQTHKEASAMISHLSP